MRTLVAVALVSPAFAAGAAVYSPERPTPVHACGGNNGC
jgi:hypothetical protein